MKGLMGMMKQAQELQTRMQDMQAELAAMELVGTSGAGLVKITINGKGEMKSVAIDPSMVKPEESEILEDLIVAAHQDARAKMEQAMQDKMQEITGGLPLPPGMNPFGA